MAKPFLNKKQVTKLTKLDWDVPKEPFWIQIFPEDEAFGEVCRVAKLGSAEIEATIGVKLLVVAKAVEL